MTDEKLINDFLEKNYTVKTDKFSFIVLDKANDKTMVPTEFSNHFLKIFGDFYTTNNETSIMLLQSWFSTKKRLLTKNLYDIFDNIEAYGKSQKQLELVIKKVNELYMLEYHEEFVTNLFLDYYKDKHLIPKLENYKNLFNTELGSSRLIEDYQDEFILEHYQLIKYAKKDLNDWYAEKVIGGKVRDFLNQLVITLGPRNWIVTWIGHGPVSRAKILNNFINEGEFHHKFIIDMYDKWYEEAVIYASDKMMRTPTPNFRLTNFVPEN